MAKRSDATLESLAKQVLRNFSERAYFMHEYRLFAQKLGESWNQHVEDNTASTRKRKHSTSAAKALLAPRPTNKHARTLANKQVASNIAICCSDLESRSINSIL